MIAGGNKHLPVPGQVAQEKIPIGPRRQAIELRRTFMVTRKLVSRDNVSVEV